MNILLTSTTSSSSGGYGIMIIWIVAMVALLYFMMIRPQRKEQKRVNNMIGSMEVGDSVVTTGGFYGVILDITDDDVIVEFGNNKNCRIPMRKTAIAQVEKANVGVVQADSSNSKSVDSSKDTAKTIAKDTSKDNVSNNSKAADGKDKK